MSSRLTEPSPSLTELLHTFGLLPAAKASGESPGAGPSRSTDRNHPAAGDAAGSLSAPVSGSLSGSSAEPVADDRGGAPTSRFFATPEVFGNWLAHLVVQERATDIYLSTAGVRLRRENRLVAPSPPVTWNATTAGTVLDWLMARFPPASVLAERFQARLRDTGAAVTSWHVGGRRFRVHVFHTGEQLSFVFRHISPGIQSVSHLGLPPGLFTWLLESTHEGLLLLSGPPGSGKSSTLSACIGFWNDCRPHHIVVIEDPAEYFYTSRTALIHQLEVGTDSSSMGEALRGALRQSPQILVVGEIRDEETARLVLQSAESGHLVAATIDAPHTFGALQRFTSFFPEREQSSVWRRLVRIFNAVIGQILLPATPADADGPEPDTRHASRLPAVEVLRRSPAVAHVLESPRCTRELVLECMERSRNEYMITMDDYLYLLLATERIELKTALPVAHSPSNLKLRIAARRETGD